MEQSKKEKEFFEVDTITAGGKTVDYKQIIELKQNYVEQYTPKTDLTIKLFVLLLFAVNFGMFLYKYIDDKSGILYFFK